MSFIEIYNEAVHDLMDPVFQVSPSAKEKNTLIKGESPPKPKKLSIVESRQGVGALIPDLSEIRVYSQEQALELMDIVKSRRVVSSNLNNANSSRSHVIIEI